jgi:lysophospholipase L1-like esterase
MTEATKLERYVAIGDSQTEGLHDYHGDGRLRGWADRFAEHLSVTHPELLYANLAVRGRRTRAIREEQLGVALSLSPDLATVVSGVNDVIGPDADIEAVASDLEAMYEQLTASGCLVMGCTFPLPRTGLTRKVAPRLEALNDAIRDAAQRQRVLLVELEAFEHCADLRFWSADRIHLNPLGHERLAAGFNATFRGCADDAWTAPLPPAPTLSGARQVANEAMWIARFLLPKLVRLVRGRSSGDGRSAKRPQLSPLNER